MRRHIQEVAFHGVRRGAVVALAAVSFQANQVFSTVATGFSETKDLDAYRERIDKFADHTEAVAQINPPVKILEKVFNN